MLINLQKLNHYRLPCIGICTQQIHENLHTLLKLTYRIYVEELITWRFKNLHQDTTHISQKCKSLIKGSSTLKLNPYQ